MIRNYRSTHRNQVWFPLLLIVFLLLLSACGPSDADPETDVSSPAQVATAVERATAVRATWTPLPVIIEDEPEPTEPPPPTNTAVPTSTIALPTETPQPTATDTLEPTATDEPTATAEPPTATSSPVPASPLNPTASPVPAAEDPSQPEATAPPPPTAESAPPAEPVLGVNLLPNPSFEEGHYNQNGVPELQLPNKWRLEWDEGPTGLGSEAWDYYVRPEARVLSTAFLPPEEHALYVYNGQHTVKIFKGNGAVNFRLMTDITLEPGTYVVEAKMFADIVDKWESRTKQWALDPTAAEFRFLVGDGGTVWSTQNYGQINVHNFTFTIDQTKTIPIGIALRGKYAIANNGWFIDDLSVRRVE